MMSNHDGSYMLNDVLKLLEKEQIFEQIGREKTVTLVTEILRMSYGHDCNIGEVLEDIGERLGVCSSCGTVTWELKEGYCDQCQ
jgi:recombinational DNA repair protein RecR